MNWFYKHKKTLRLILMILVVFFLMAFSKKRHQNQQINQIDIQIEYYEELLITQSFVNNLLIEKIRQSHFAKLDDLVLNDVEDDLKNHPMFLNSTVYKTINGTLKVHVKQKKPLARYHGSAVRFYIAEDGQKMPLSEVQSARVPIITGQKEVVLSKDFIQLLTIINQDEFLKKNITAIEAKPNKSLRLKNRLFNFDVEFGKLVSIEKKMFKYKAFLLKGIQDNNLDQYKIVNLIYNNQIVCSK